MEISYESITRAFILITIFFIWKRLSLTKYTTAKNNQQKID